MIEIRIPRGMQEKIEQLPRRSTSPRQSPIYAEPRGRSSYRRGGRVLLELPFVLKVLKLPLDREGDEERLILSFEVDDLCSRTIIG